MYRRFSILLCLITLSACVKKVELYKYKAQDDSAYLIGAASEELGILYISPKSLLFPMLIDGQKVREVPVTLTVNEPQAKTALEQSKMIGVPLAPGDHSILGCFIAGNGVIAPIIKFTAKPHEQYFIKTSVVWEINYLRPDFPEKLSYWVENSTHEKVVSVMTVHPAHGHIADCGIFYVD